MTYPDELDPSTLSPAPQQADLHDAPAPEETDVEDIVDFDDDDIGLIKQALTHDRHSLVTRLLNELTPADTAELIEKIGPQQREHLIATHGTHLAPEVFTYLQEDILVSILEHMPALQVAGIVAALESDDALNLIAPLAPDFRADVVRHLSAKTRVALEEGLSFPEESAGRLMQREIVAIPEFWTVGKTLDYLHAAASELPEIFFDIFIISPTYHVVGSIPLTRLVTAGRSEKMRDLAMEVTYSIPANMDQEEVALLFKREDLSSAPVVDEDGRLLGMITSQDIVHVIADEAEEDFLKIAGVGDGDFYRDIKHTTKSRASWLAINLLTAVLASWVISFFEGTISQIVALAVLMPIVASMGGNAGTQTLTVAVRALATHELSNANMWRAIGKETLIGALNGAGFAVITGLFAAFWFSSAILGLVIGAAMIINLIVAGLMGSVIPVVLDKMGYDPAESSTVFLTTFTDVVGFFAFLGLASVLML